MFSKGSHNLQRHKWLMPMIYIQQFKHKDMIMETNPWTSNGLQYTSGKCTFQIICIQSNIIDGYMCHLHNKNFFWKCALDDQSSSIFCTPLAIDHNWVWRSGLLAFDYLEVGSWVVPNSNDEFIWKCKFAN